MKRKPFILLKLDSATAEILVYGAIASWSDNNAKAFKMELKKAEEDGYTNLKVRINSVGGEVFDGLAMIQSLRDTKLNISIHIDGLAASMASVFVTVPKAKVYMSKNARLMIHQSNGWQEGGSEDMRRQADLMDSFNEQMAELYAKRVGKDKQWVLDNWMEHGKDTWFTADEALKAGLVDEIEDGLVSENEEQEVRNIAARYDDELMPTEPQKQTKNGNKMKNLIALFTMLTSIQFEKAPVVAIEPSGEKGAPTEDDLKKGISMLTAKFDEVAAENVKLKKQIKDDAKKNLEDKAKMLVNTAKEAGKIVDAQVATYEKLALADFESTEAALNGMKGRDPLSGGAPPANPNDPLLKLSWDEAHKQDKLELIKEKHPEHFAQLKAEKFPEA
ncbi:MAG: Clp protease ClpP [Ekhidna sp.]|uniref:head maturation protease, ClpP-related n=1 Tax=Ekhidna sp. TaxID=2608089 RepID=UPI0032EB7CFC